MLDQAWQVTSTEKESAEHDIEAGRERDIASVRSYTPPPRLPTPVWPANWPIPQTKDQAISSVKADRDIRTITTKGYRSLGLASTFIAGVEAQFYSVIATVDLGNNPLLQAASGLLLVGIVFSAAGAVTSLLAARWFEYAFPNYNIDFGGSNTLE
ncbi:hypothetical protein FRC09_011177 [Ceratobasidium sp. 395]|nr:hypothetical protein FRC09_011177 [Ceratobasidium sp. 395]